MPFFFEASSVPKMNEQYCLVDHNCRWIIHIVWLVIIVGTLRSHKYPYLDSHLIIRIKLCVVLMTSIVFASHAGQKSIMTIQGFHPLQTLTFGAKSICN